MPKPKTKTPALSYKSAGVDIAAGDRLVKQIARMAAATKRPEVLSGIGLFAAGIRIPTKFKNPILMTGTDGVGTKLLVARLMDRHDTIGIDLVAMNANDILTSGAEPLCFLDYLAVGGLAAVPAADIVSGVANGCRQSGMSLVGGETAEMPGIYKSNEYDLAGFAIGVVEKRNIIDGTRVRPGHVLIGLESSGLHSNGYSLARKALRATSARALRKHSSDLGESIGEALLRPTTIYVKPVLAAVKKFRIDAMAHITGGGLAGNVVRVLPKNTRAVIERETLPDLPLLELVRSQGRIPTGEMDKTFNNGIGYVLCVRATDADSLVSFLRRRRTGARVIGNIESGRRGVKLVGAK